MKDSYLISFVRSTVYLTWTVIIFICFVFLLFTLNIAEKMIFSVAISNDLQFYMSTGIKVD